MGRIALDPLYNFAMSERTAASLAVLDRLLPALSANTAGAHHQQLIEEAEALRRAVAAFHLEAIRFRMYAVDRLIHIDGDDPTLRGLVEELRHELETAGFHTRSHAAP
jgi:hypothetical protein